MRLRSRRGVLLLVVLSLLVLFLMIGTAFIITAKQSEKSSKTAAKAAFNDARDAARGSLLDDAIHQLIRDTDNPNSVLRGHSLLADLYGNDGFKATITKVQWAKPSVDGDADPATGMPVGTGSGMPGGVTRGQMVQFVISAPTDLYNNLYLLSGLDNAYSGQVVTFISAGAPTTGTAASAKNVSTRIVGYLPLASNQAVITVLAFQLANGSLLTNPGQLNNSQIVVNGRPFNGTGDGFNPYSVTADARLDAGEIVPGVTLTVGSVTAPPPIALLPNPVYFTPANANLSTLSLPRFTGSAVAAAQAYLPLGSDSRSGRGGADESYDAADFQNMFLAVMQDQPEDQQNPGASLQQMVLPSFHRPELINFWAAQLVSQGATPLAKNAILLRKILLRPNHLDHPNFTGSNAQFASTVAAYQANTGDATLQQAMVNAYVFGPWDVDNDNDGNRDSVWVDVGAPVVMGPNGKLVKPLVAFLCIDLDGRLNVNAHGSPDVAGLTTAVSETVQIAGNSGTMSNATPRGMGWGPADISLEAAIGQNSFKGLFYVPPPSAGGTATIPGRLGRDGGAGRGQNYDGMSQIDRFGWPQWGGQFVRSTFAMPPDVRSRYGTSLNALGQVVLEATMTSETGGSGSLCGDSPYEAPLYAEGVDTYNGPASNDAPFSLAELERILRAYDTDGVSLPDRLANLAGAGSSPAERNRITTDSWDLPAPNIAMPPEFEALLAPATIVDGNNQPVRRQPRSAAELLEMRVREALFPNVAAKLFPAQLAGDPTDGTTDAGKVRFVMRQILAPELAAGVRLNINRPFGNGLDDNNNGVVDEPGEDGLATRRAAWANYSAGGSMTPEPLNANFTSAQFTPLDVNGDGILDDTSDSPQQRQLLARHLYVMALAMSADPGYTGVRTLATTANKFDDAALARRLAQWAVNVVDFRDVDDIMTPFEYDVNPFDGWLPDGDLRTVPDHVGPDGQSNPSSPQTLVDDTFVWGAERPELVMTETMAWHDRRTQDLASEDAYPPNGDKPALTNPDQEDPDYDQLVRPRGAFFVELYNPNPAMPGASADTHDIRVSGGQAYDWGVDLRAVDKSSGNSPVWRLAIYKRTPPGSDMNPVANASLWDPDERSVQAKNPTSGALQVYHPPMPMDRSIYFTTFDPATKRANPNKWDDDGVAFFADPAHPENVGSVRPGRYLVVGGGRQITGAGVYSSPIGDLAQGGQLIPGSQVEFSPRRRIDLSVGSDHTVRLVDYKLDGSPLQDMTDAAVPFGVQAPAEADLVATGLVPQMATGSQPRPASVADVAIIDFVDDTVNDVVDPTGKGYGDDNLSGPKRRPLTISEPARGYIDRFMNAEWNEKSGCYRNPQTSAVPLDVPLDGPIDNTAKTSKDVKAFLDARLDSKLNPAWSDQYPPPKYLNNADPALCRVGQMADADADPRVSYAFIYLQRLANPTLPWNPEAGHPAHDPSLQVNPYLTVDEMSTDLTVFNGRPQAPPQSKHGYEEEGTNTSDTMASTFSSLERGGSGFQTTPPNYQPSLWFQQRPSQGRTREPIVRRNVYQGNTNGNLVIQSPPLCTLGFLGTPLKSTAAPTGTTAASKAAQRQLQPLNPFQWVTWNNRPYIGGNELMLVPHVRSSMLMREFSDLNNTNGNLSPYVAPTTADLSKVNMATLSRPPYGAFAHLESFLYEPGANAPAAGLPLHLYRMLDLVGTPSLYVGAQTWLNPTQYAGMSTTLKADDPRNGRQPPFDNVSTFREPGRVNLNTIFSPAVYAGLFHNDDAGAADVQPQAQPTGGNRKVHPGPTWIRGDDSFLRSRRGYGAAGSQLDMLTLNSAMPTFFANPFRSANAADLVPLPTMVRQGVEGTLFRSTSASPGTLDSNPLFAAATAEPPTNVTGKYPERDSNRNPFFRYAPMVRLNNLTTTRSNVFAVWATVGFFEVEPADRTAFNSNNSALSGQAQTDMYNRVYPDGYQFGKEDGLDEGNVRRLRGFYIIDRTRPAAFLPGVDANTENTIRLHRRIE